MTTTAPLRNWEEELLKQSLSKRVSGGFGAFWVAGQRIPTEPPPVPPIILTGGIPDPDSLPIEELIESSNTILRREGKEALRYGGHQGHTGLREWLAQHYSAQEGMSLTADNFTITNGISGAIINVCETFLDEGDVGLVESPSFPGGAGTIRNCMADVVSVPLDEHGLNPAELEKIIERLKGEGRRVKLLYTIPNFQNPTGSTLSFERRKAVVEICQRHNVVIAEDDAYGDIRFEGERPPTLFALAGGKGAIFMGTFSKTVATGLRIGWVMADQGAIDALLQTRYDLGVSPWLQRALQEYCVNGTWDRHVAKMCDLYRRKRDIMVSALDERCSRYATWNAPEGGFFLWLDLADSVDPQALADAARRHGLAYVGGGGFYLDGGGKRSVRLAFSHVSDAEIPEAILRLGRAMEEAAHSS